MKQCAKCGIDFTPKTKKHVQKYCSAKCSDAAQWIKRTTPGYTPKTRIKYINKEHFDWREYENKIII